MVIKIKLNISFPPFVVYETVAMHYELQSIVPRTIHASSTA